MKPEKPDPVVFRKGTRTIRHKYGVVTVVAPRDITLGEIRPGLERMMRDARSKEL